jgi:tRNA dimethylallyltransferase
MAARLVPSDPQRLVRALEVIDATGLSLAEWQGVNAAPVLTEAEAVKIVVAPEREAVYAAVEARFDLMLDRGAIAEVRQLLELNLDPDLPALRAHGVRELQAYLAGTVDLEQAVAKAKTESRRYAKRQMTWARRYMADWQWVPDTNAAVAAAAAKLATP